MKKRYFCALALSAALIGCETNSLDESSINLGNSTKITVEGVGFGAETRMSVTPDANNEVWAVEWEQDDKVAGWFSDGSASAFSMVALADDANLATFTGTAPSAATMRFIYPCDVEAVGSDGSLKVDLSAQTIDMSDPYMTYGDNNMYMLSDAFAVSASETAHPTMHHLMAGMELAITPSNVGDASYVPTKAVITGLNSTATVAFADGAVTGADGTMTLTIDNASALVDGQVMLLPFSVVPFTTTGSESVTIELHFSDGTTATGTKSGITSGLEFKAGEHSTMEFDFEVVAEDPAVVIEIGATYDDGVDKGIIWWIADDGSSCKITNIVGGSDPTKYFTPDATNLIGIDALDEDDGYANTQLFLNAENYSATNFPLFAWVAELGEGWYIPSKNEYITMLPMYYSNSAFKAALTSYGDAIYSGTFYWASTLDSDNPTTKAWALKYWGASSKTVTTYGVTGGTNGRAARASKIISLKDYSGYTMISSAADLAKIGVDDAYPLDGSYCLTSNIDLSSYSSWTPIGTYSSDGSTPFTGTFDGCNYTITGLTIDASAYFQGLFGYVYGGTVKDLTISNAYVKNTSMGAAVAAALVEGYSTIENVTVEGGTVTASASYSGGVVAYSEYSDIISCSSSVTLSSSASYVGGVIGYGKYANITSSTMSGDITGTNSGVGGVLGYSYGATVTSCVNSGSITVSGSSKYYAGGIVGYDNTNGTGVITGCSNSGTITGDTNFTYIGGILGYGLTTSTITDCYNTGAITGVSYVGGISGYGASIISSCYNTGNITGLGGNYVGGIAGNVHNTTKCYNTGTISSTGSYVGGIAGTPCFDDKSFEPMNYLTACYNTGSVSGNAAIGGILGRTTNASITVTSCYNYSSVTGSGSNVAAVVGNLSTVNSFVLSCYFVNFSGSDIGIFTNNNNGEATEVTIAGLNAAVTLMNEAAGDTYYVAGSSDTTLPSFK